MRIFKVQHNRYILILAGVTSILVITMLFRYVINNGMIINDKLIYKEVIMENSSSKKYQKANTKHVIVKHKLNTKTGIVNRYQRMNIKKSSTKNHQEANAERGSLKQQQMKNAKMKTLQKTNLKKNSVKYLKNMIAKQSSLKRLQIKKANNKSVNKLQKPKMISVKQCQKLNSVVTKKFKAENCSVVKLLEQSLHMLNTDKRRRYIVYDCSRANPGVCGGWSDRLSGILSTLVIAILTNRNFLIRHNRPYALGDFLIPTNLLDWRYNKSILISKTSLYQDLSARKSTTLRPYLRGKLDVTSYFKHDVDFLRINWDFTEEFRKRPSIGTEIPWITKLHYADIYRQLFMSLFKPSPLFSDALNKFRNKRRRPKIACAHLRVGRNPDMPGDDPRSTLKLDAVWNYLHNLNKSTYDIFVASDAEHVKKIARNRFPTNIIDSPGKITHIDQPNGNDPSAGFLKQLLDFYTLLNCDVLITSASGFSIFAAYIRGTDSGLYCLASGGLLPCSRYTINDIFPGEFLAPAK